MKKKIIILVIIVLVLAIGGGATWYFFLKPQPAPGWKRPTAENYEYKNYGVRFDDVSFSRTSIDAGIAAGDDNLAKVLNFLDVIDANLIAADYVANASTGSGTASSSLFEMQGSLDFGDIYIRENGKYYSQSVARVTEATTSFKGLNLITVARGMLDQADRQYSADGITFYRQEVKGGSAAAEMIEPYPYGSATFEEGELETLTLEEYNQKEYVNNDYRELSNFEFASDTIKADSVTVELKDGLYTFSFDVNLTDTAARDKATEHSRAGMRKASSSNDLEYVLYKVTIEMWDNGLIRKYNKKESWAATLSLPLGLAPHGESYSDTSIYYSWDPADCTFAGNNIDITWAK
jgi:hypothetical protein